jgi:CRISPR-associated protein Cas5d
MSSPFVRVKVSGPLACFTRPETKVERMSYEVPTPSSARGILDAILWKPEIRWHVRRIEVLRPIRFIPLKRNEVQSKVAPKSIHAWMTDAASYAPMAAGAGSEEGTPRNTLALRDVAYVIEAEPIVYDAGKDGQNTPMKYAEMFNRRVKSGQCFTQPYFGCREFAAAFEPPTGDERPIEETHALGLMLYDVVFDPEQGTYRAVFFDAELKNGVVETDVVQALSDEATRQEVLACSYRR